jgi:LPS sulfotransferase NodH
MQISSGNNEIQRVCVLTGQRSGSSWFMQLLGDHPDICAYAELFVNLPVPPDFPDKSILPKRMYFEFCKETGIPRRQRVTQFLEEIYEQARDKKVLAYKVMYNQLRTNPELLWFLCRHHYKFIHLVRENYLDVAISVQALKKTKISHSYGAVSALDKLHINIPEALKEMQRRQLYVRLADMLLAVLPARKIRISYEELQNDPQSTLGKVYDFIGVSRQDFNPGVGFKKIIRKNPKELISNYDELLQALKGTHYERYLSAA